MLRSLTAKQFIEWEAYAQLSPLDDTKDDYRSASIREMVYNVAVEAKHRRPIKDFLLDWEAETEEEKEARLAREREERVAMHRRIIPVLAMAFAAQQAKEP